MQFTNPNKGKTVKVLIERLRLAKSVSDVNPQYLSDIIEELNSRELSEEEAVDFKNVMNLSFDGKLTEKSDSKNEVSENAIKKIKRESNIEPSRYTVLKTIIGLLSILGYIVISIGIIALISSVTGDRAIMGFAYLVISIIIALPLIAFSNLINVFIDIEYNTRKTKEAIKETIK